MEALPMRALALPVLLALAAPLLAGCLAAPVAPAGLTEPVAALGPLPALGYRCLGAGAEAPAAEPCLAALARDDATLQEPFAAAHPTDPRILAVGVNFGPSVVERAAGFPAGDSHVCKLGIYVTEDGGATWRETFAPPPAFPTGPLGPTPTQCAGDPALVIEEDGTLHATGIATAGNLPGPLGGLGLAGDGVGFRTYYVRSDDLGRTWGEPVILSDAGESQDRNWITRDPATGILYVNWQNTEGDLEDWTNQIAWSADRGATWRVQAPEQRVTCFTVGQVVFRDGEVLSSCTQRHDGEDHALVYAFDPATGDATVRAELEDGGFWPFLAALRGGRLALTEDTPDGTTLRWSDDGGRTWTAATPLIDLVEGTWDSAVTTWAEPDPHGGLGLIVQVARADLASPVGGTLAATLELRHLELDPAGRVAHEVPLAAWTTPALPPLRGAQPLGDHYHGIAWGPAGGLLAFTRESAVQLALAVPEALAPETPGPAQPAA